ncbi:rod shape-determining protein RodA [Candidatus Parcubacteria bacterium]|nr:rod shape-determining protein RodA [Candidatus Parcubacteria bacterium]
MFNKIFAYLKNYDWIILVSIVLLIIFGLAEIYSIALSNEDLNLLNFKKQIFFVVLGMFLLFFISFLDYYNLRSFNVYFYIAGVLLLTAVLFFGETIRNTTGWFDFGFFNLQPVEFVKIFLLIFLARYFSGVSVKLNPLKYLIISGLATAVLIALVLLQPDFGSALILFALWGAMVYIAGFSKKYILIIFVILLLVFLGGWFFFFEDYQRQRIMTFVNPGADPLDRGYNVTQAIIAVGSGGITGRGIGFGSQSQLKFLPEAQNDFIFAVIAEELGFFGVFLIIGFFSVFYFRLIHHIGKIKDDFGIYFILGAVSLIFLQMFINIGMNIGLLPVVGLSLPFVSYGGSAMISCLIMVGILESIIIRSKIKG